MLFKNPWFFLLLALLVPYVVWYVLRYKKSQPSLKMPETSKYRYVGKSWRLYLMHAPFILRVMLFTLVVFVLARPQTEKKWSDTDVEGIDIMLSVDVSTSMLAEDFKPNRLEALKEIAKGFIDRRPNDRIGLSLFAGEAYTECPLTLDHTALLNYYNKVDCNMAAYGTIADGTAIGDGIMNSLVRLRESTAASKVIILLTDGVNNSGNISPLTAAQIAKEQNVRIYTIGVGKNGMAPFPILPYGGTAMMPVEIDEQTCAEVAAMTGGTYFRAKDADELKKIYSEIDEMERTKYNIRQYGKRNEVFEPFALAALIVFLLELFLRLFVLRRLP